MQLDLETIRWALSGFFFVGCGLISFLLHRSINKVDEMLDTLENRIDTAHSRINVIERDYVKSEELDKTFELYLAPIKVALDSINKKLDKIP